MTKHDVAQLLAGMAGTGGFYIAFVVLPDPLCWVTLLGWVASAALIVGPVWRHED